MDMGKQKVEGFYAAYLTGVSGNGVVLLAMRSASVAGVDIAGGQYKGSYKTVDGSLQVNLEVKLPPNTPMLQGGHSGVEQESHRFDFVLPPNFTEIPFVRVEGKKGPVNARFVKLRDIDD